MFRQKWFYSVVVVRCVEQLGIGAIQGCLSVRNIGLRFVDRSGSPIDICCGAIGIGARRSNGTHLRSDRAALIGDLAFESIQVRLRLFKRVFIGSGIDLKQHFPLFDKGVILHCELSNRPIDLGSDTDEVSEYLGVISAWESVGLPNDYQSGDQSGGNDRNADHSAQMLTRRSSYDIGHGISLPD